MGTGDRKGGKGKTRARRWLAGPILPWAEGRRLPALRRADSSERPSWGKSHSFSGGGGGSLLSFSPRTGAVGPTCLGSLPRLPLWGAGGSSAALGGSPLPGARRWQVKPWGGAPFSTHPERWGDYRVGAGGGRRWEGAAAPSVPRFPSPSPAPSLFTHRVPGGGGGETVEQPLHEGGGRRKTRSAL